MQEPNCATFLPAVAPRAELAEPCFCTVVFNLPGGQPAITGFLRDLSEHLEHNGNAFVAKFEVGDHLPPR